MTDLQTPIDQWLAEQADLSAVTRFAQRQDAALLPADQHLYRDLIPLGRPRPGEQYAFEVDLDACSGCKACVTACHRLNGLDAGESFRSVGLLVGVDGGQAFQQTVTTACHHCADPACLTGCPVDAYEKDPVTGVVIHLDDQCIGCQYCTLTCPYEVPTFNDRLGIVRKCDLCHGRLAEGEAPACVQACPTSAITVGIVSTEEMAARALEGPLVAGAPASTLTTPSTTYRGSRARLDLRSADAAVLRPAQPHAPLAAMLVLTQLAVGTAVVSAAIELMAPAAESSGLHAVDGVISAGVGSLALLASLAHLGRPQYAWRAVIGLRHSWLSREIIAFASFALLAFVDAAGSFQLLGRSTAVGVGALVAGVVGVACSVQVYAVTGRRWWRWAVLGPKLALSAVSTGAASLLVVATVNAAALVGPLAVALLIAAGVKLAGEASILRHRSGPLSEPDARTARLLLGPLRTQTRWRFALGSAGLAFALLTLISGALLPAAAAAVATLAGELVERHQLFTAVAAPRMPGGLG